MFNVGLPRSTTAAYKSLACILQLLMPQSFLASINFLWRRTTLSLELPAPQNDCARSGPALELSEGYCRGDITMQSATWDASALMRCQAIARAVGLQEQPPGPGRSVCIA